MIWTRANRNVFPKTSAKPVTPQSHNHHISSQCFSCSHCASNSHWQRVFLSSFLLFSSPPCSYHLSPCTHCLSAELLYDLYLCTFSADCRYVIEAYRRAPALVTRAHQMIQALRRFGNDRELSIVWVSVASVAHSKLETQCRHQTQERYCVHTQKRDSCHPCSQITAQAIINLMFSSPTRCTFSFSPPVCLHRRFYDEFWLSSCGVLARAAPPRLLQTVCC